jgi:ribonuclease HIII
VERELAKKQLDLELTQRTKGESDAVVAGASILARAAFVEEIDRLGEAHAMTLPKGASSAVIAAGRKLLQSHGREALGAVAKLHFKTLDAIDPSFRE